MRRTRDEENEERERKQGGGLCAMKEEGMMWKEVGRRPCVGETNKRKRKENSSPRAKL